MTSLREQPVLAFASRAAWEAWLDEQHAACAGLWLKIAKKGAAGETVSYPEAIEVALCYGWIDGQKKHFDGDYWLQRFTPRTSRSKWSKINRDKAERLIEVGLMRSAGRREVERAKADGRWQAAYSGQASVAVPDDLRRELAKNTAAREFFAALDSANRYAILYRLEEATRPETRARRLEKFVAMLSEGKKVHPKVGR